MRESNGAVDEIFGIGSFTCNGATESEVPSPHQIAGANLVLPSRGQPRQSAEPDHVLDSIERDMGRREPRPHVVETHAGLTMLVSLRACRRTSS